jgi:hypothetical protein
MRDPWAIHRADVQGLAGLKYIDIIKYTIEYMAEGDSNPRYRFWPVQRFSKLEPPRACCLDSATYVG